MSAFKENRVSEELAREDYEFFLRLSSAYQACTLTAVCPVVLPASEEIDGTHISSFSHMFYDAHDDEEYALSFMRKRIANAREDIQAHGKLHRLLLEHFETLDESIAINDRNLIASTTNRLSHSLLDYTELVRQHQQRIGAKAFLHYLTCPPGHFYHLKNTQYFAEKRFNPEQTFFGAVAAVKEIDDSLETFQQGEDSMANAFVMDIPDNGKGIMDASLRGRIALNEELLRRAEFFH